MTFQKLPRYPIRVVHAYLMLAALYILLIFLLPADQQIMRDHNLTSQEYHMLLLAVALPFLFIWFVAFYGYSKLREYAKFVKKSSEGDGFKWLSTGCGWLAWSLPVTAITALIVSSMAGSHGSFHSAAVIITNYVNLLFPLTAFSLIGIASRNLFSQAKISFSTTSIRSIMLAFVTAGVLYCYLIFRHFDSSNLGSTNNTYFLPVWAIVLTLIVPYLYAWFVGLLAAYEIIEYSRRVRGVLYKQALHLLVSGLVAVIVASIAQQYITSIVPNDGHLLLNFRLIIAVIFRILGGLGYILIAWGAIRLKKIEEV